MAKKGKGNKPKAAKPPVYSYTYSREGYKVFKDGVLIRGIFTPHVDELGRDPNGGIPSNRVGAEKRFDKVRKAFLARYKAEAEAAMAREIEDDRIRAALRAKRYVTGAD